MQHSGEQCENDEVVDMYVRNKWLRWRDWRPRLRNFFSTLPGQDTARRPQADQAARLSLAQTNTGDYDDGAGGTGDKGEQAIVGSPIVAGVMNERLKELTTSFAKAIGKELDYCIKDT